MRYYLIFLFIFFTLWGMAQINVGTNFRITAPIPIDKRSVAASLVERDAISPSVRYVGLVVFVESESKNYQLSGGILNTHWKDITSSPNRVDTTSCPNGVFYAPQINTTIIYNDSNCLVIDTIFLPDITTTENVAYIIKKKSVCNKMVIFCLSESDKIHSAYKNEELRQYSFNNNESGVIHVQNSGFSWEIIHEEIYLHL